MISNSPVGGKKPLRYLSVTRLHLDVNNPRLPEEIQGESESKVLTTLKKQFYLEELAYSLAENGYFDEEPLVAIPKNLPDKFKKMKSEILNLNTEYLDFIDKKSTEFVVIEGNRRLATIMFLLYEDIRNQHGIRTWPTISKKIREDLELLPVIIYPERETVLQYLGVRHITGILKWEPFAKARYISYLISKNFSMDDIQAKVGDTTNSVRRIYFCYRLVEEAKDDFDINVKEVEENFSFLILATGQKSIKDYLGIPKKWNDVNFKKPISKSKIENLQNVFSWIFGDKDKRPVIDESRDITNKLSPILKHKSATSYLSATRQIDGALERTDVEEKRVEKYLQKVNDILDMTVGLINRHKTEKVKEEVTKLQGTIKVIIKILSE